MSSDITKNMVNNPNHFGRLSLEELSDFENANQTELPKDYKQFLLLYNGGKPLRANLEEPATAVTYILGMHNGEHYASLYKHINLFAGRLPFSTFPIATDAFGNLFIMSLHPDSYGQIFFWEHEGETEFQDGHYIDNVSFVASSFSNFVSKLH